MDRISISARSQAVLVLFSRSFLSERVKAGSDRESRESESPSVTGRRGVTRSRSTSGVSVPANKLAFQLPSLNVNAK